MTFLTAEWRKLLMANYIVPPELLKPFVPWGTELDFWQGRCYISLVGFMFLKTKLLGVPIPFHRDFEEANLRFYVRRKVGDSWRRGAVFIKEIVPKPAISLVANVVYRESYTTHWMRHNWDLDDAKHLISYEWKPFFKGDWYKMAAETDPNAQPIGVGSEEEFITEHYWGYARAGKSNTNEYQVQHPRWDVYKVRSHEISGDFGSLYGKEFREILAAPPVSVFVAEGSEISIMEKTTLKL
ncbi:MAG: YqjF family protein [Saprospiraceae bacterium]